MHCTHPDSSHQGRAHVQGYRRSSIYRLGQTTGAAQPGMANLLAQPRAGHCRHGPVRCSNYRFRPVLCLSHRPARPQRPRWINVTANPTAEWVSRQITEAFPSDEGSLMSGHGIIGHWAMSDLGPLFRTSGSLPSAPVKVAAARSARARARIKRRMISYALTFRRRGDAADNAVSRAHARPQNMD
jgi:hypothetical protein